MNLPYQPRPWQTEAALRVGLLAQTRQNFRAVVQAATGAGKTRFFYLIGFALGRRFLFVVHLDTLADQVEREVKELFPSLKVGVVKAARGESDGDFVVASVQTLKNPERLQDLVQSESRRGPFALIGIDEVHHAGPGSTYERVLDAFPDRPALGLTATPARMDKKDLALVWKDSIVYRYPIPRAQGDGILVPVTDGRGGERNRPHRLVVPGIDVKAALAAEKAGDREAARRAIGDKAWPEVAKETAFACLELGRRVIIFTPDVESARLVAEHACSLGVKAAAVDGKIPKREVKNRLAAHRAGELQALSSCQILLEGYDDRSITGVIWARQTLSANCYIQGVGRGLRTSPETGKVDCLVSDLCGAHEAHGFVSGESFFLDQEATPDLAAEEVEALAKDAPTDEQEDRKTILWRSFLSCLAGTRSLASATCGKRVAWLPAIDERLYTHATSDGRTLLLEKSGELWVPYAEPRERGRPAFQLAPACSLEDAKAIAESAGRAGTGIDSRESGWRDKAASEKALNALAKWKVKVDGDLRAGEASDLLSMAVAKMRSRDRYRRGIVTGGACAFE